MLNEIFIIVNVGTFTLERIGRARIPASNRNFIYVKFNFSEAWDGLSKTAIFSKDGLDTAHLPIENGVCKVPNAFMEKPGTILLSVFAGDLRTVNNTKIEVIPSGYQEGVPPLPPEPSSVYVQSPDSSVPFIRSQEGAFQFYSGGEWNEVQGGEGGASGLLWRPAVDASGNISWERSSSVTAPATQNIKGPAGEKGEAGDQGPAGPQGLQGDRGQDGLQGPAGPQGEKGDRGEQGTQGEPGPKGESFDPADVLRIDNLETSVSDLQSESIAKWVLLNEADNRSRENATRIDALEESGVGGGITADLPWCSGYFQNRSLTVNAWNILTPIYEDGDSSMISGDTFVIPEDGVYMLSVGGGATQASSTAIYAAIIKNSITISGNYSLVLAINQHYTTVYLPVVTIAHNLKSGDYLTHIVYPTTAQTTINALSASHKFTLLRLR